MTRITAFLTHLGISLLIFFVLLYFIVFIWYPQPFFTTDGGWQGIRIVAAVDLVLGPLLTLIVFKPGKPSLKFDMSVIAIIQLTALCWGIWVTYHERPVAVVFTEDHLNPVTAYQVKENGLKPGELEKYGADFPRYIYSQLPQDLRERTTFLSKAFSERKPLYLYTELYKEIGEKEKNTILQSGMDILALAEKPGDIALIKKSLADMSQDYSQLSFIPLLSRHKKVIAVFDRATFQFIDLIDIDPGKMLEKFQAQKIQQRIEQERQLRLNGIGPGK